MSLDTVGIILAAGNGKRFFPFTVKKPLFPFMGKPLIEYIIDDYTAMGIQDTIIVVSDTELEQYSQLSSQNIHLVIQPKPLGMGDALLRCKDLINHRPMVVRNGNNSVNADFSKVAKEGLVKKAPFIPVTRVNSYLPYGYIIMSGNQATGVIEKPGEGNEPSKFVKEVFDYFPNSDAFFEILSHTTSPKDDVYEQALNTFMQQTPVECLQFEGDWHSLKYPWHVHKMTQLLLKKKLVTGNAGATISPGASIQGEVYLGKDVVVMEGAVIKGPSYIGDRTIIGTHALVRESMIEADCEIGFGSEIVRSYVGNHCKIHTSYVGDSILQSNVHMGARTTTANLRLDRKTIVKKVQGERVDTKMPKLGAMIGDNVAIGIHVGLMPGVRIKSGTVIKPGEIVNET